MRAKAEANRAFMSSWFLSQNLAMAGYAGKSRGESQESGPAPRKPLLHEGAQKIIVVAADLMGLYTPASVLHGHKVWQPAGKEFFLDVFGDLHFERQTAL